MKHTCTRCNDPVGFGREVVQMLEGRWYGGRYITPAFATLFAEWHRPCFHHELTLSPQSYPYKCDECCRDISSGDKVSFLVIGEETGEGSTVAERRGDQIYNVKHYPSCRMPTSRL